jgi:succinylglutamate desuccinylase
MEIDKLSKAELIVKVVELNNKIEELGHLRSAVDVKDKEIIELGKVKNLLEKDLQDLKNVKSNLAQVSLSLESKTQELVKLRSDFETYKKTAPAAEVLENLKKDVKIQEDRNKALLDFLNPYVTNVRSLLKGLQGTLELGIETEAILSEKINKK